MTTADSSADSYTGELRKQPALLVTDCKSPYDAIHKEGAALSSTDKRLVIELATVKSRPMEGEAELRWIDARYHIADCFTMHASRKFEEVEQPVISQAHWRITAAEAMLETRRAERCQEAFVRMRTNTLRPL